MVEVVEPLMSIEGTHARHGVRCYMPSKITENAFVEAFNRRFKPEFLNKVWFLDLEEAVLMIEQ